VRVAAVVSDLLLFSKIETAASAAGATLVRVDEPARLPAEVDLVLVDWSTRRPDWAATLAALDGPRVVLFGPHTDLAAHADARASGLGPMWARSKLVAELRRLLEHDRQTS
jgi:hypothetical protein